MSKKVGNITGQSAKQIMDIAIVMVNTYIQLARKSTAMFRIDQRSTQANNDIEQADLVRLTSYAKTSLAPTDRFNQPDLAQ